MKIAAYFSPLDRLRNPTGVGRHAIEMIRHLAETQEVSLLAPRAQMDAARHLFEGAALRHANLPLPDRFARVLLTATDLLPADAWCAGADWIYSPREHAVHAKRPRIAATVHDVVSLEPAISGLPGTGDPAKERKVRRALQRIDRKCQAILCVSEFTKRRLLELRAATDESRLHVVGNGVSQVFFDADERPCQELLAGLGAQAGDYVLVPGSLTWRKGGDLMVKFAESLARRKASTKVIVAGRRHDADLLAMLEEKRREVPGLPLATTGYVEDAVLASLMRNAACVALPSRYEGFGIPVLEAMAAGAPTVVCRGSALEEAGGSAAAAIPQGDLAALEEAVASMQGAERTRRVAEGRERAKAFTWARCRDRVVQALEGART